MGRWRVDAGPPRAGRHFPGSWVEFHDWFDTEAAARAYVEAVRFRDGYRCPSCAHDLTRRGERWWCSRCRRWVRLTAGTLFEHTRVPLRTWLMVLWEVTATKVGVPALSLQRIAGVT